MKKKLNIFNATTETGKEIGKAKSKNSFVVGKFSTIKDGEFTIGILLSSDLKPRESKEFMENFARNERGNYFLAYIPLNIFYAFEVNQNLNLSSEELDNYLDSAFKLTGVEELIIEAQMKYKVAA
jgi:hypothetical protein